MERCYFVWVDSSGFTRLTLYNTTSGFSAFQVYLLAASNADFLNSVENTLIVNPAPLPGSSLYANVSDSAVLVFQSGGGEQVSIQIPAPKSSIFLSDQQTVDASAIASLIGACIGNLVTASGATVTSFIGGFRRGTVRENYSQ